ncbi:MAG TPA: hypothetical protein VN999_02970 [Thermoanaerobaculia bacterium]|nr:hypothetical protein [Thermoanaerobaculia bacterium]
MNIDKARARLGRAPFLPSRAQDLHLGSAGLALYGRCATEIEGHVRRAPAR